MSRSERHPRVSAILARAGTATGARSGSLLVLTTVLALAPAKECFTSQAPAGEAGKAEAKPAAGAAPTEIPGNLLVNPGFERGSEGWTAMAGNPNWGPFETVAFPVRTGLKAAHLHVASPKDAAEKVKVFGVVQEVRPAVFPDVVSGWYYVGSWEKSDPSPSLYMQMVVIVWGDPRTPTIVDPANPPVALKNYQIRYYLAGITEPPFTLRNAKLKFVGKGMPKLGEWVRFEIPIKKDFLESWGVIPEGYEFIRILFEGRWDNLQPGVSVRSDVYYDDLYAGPAPAPR